MFFKCNISVKARDRNIDIFCGMTLIEHYGNFPITRYRLTSMIYKGKNAFTYSVITENI